MKHGYTNRTDHEANVVRKHYQGPDAAERAAAEQVALSSPPDVFPVPRVIASEPGTLTTEFVDGDHGQDLIDLGHAHVVLQESGRVLRRLHSLDPALISPHSGDTVVIQHGDFGPNNLLFDRHTRNVTAVVDWEFCRVGPAITDIAWCEWIVRAHHPDAQDELGAFFDAYGTRPAWADRQAEMLRRCASWEEFSRRWDPNGPGVAAWHQRTSQRFTGHTGPSSRRSADHTPLGSALRPLPPLAPRDAHAGARRRRDVPHRSDVTVRHTWVCRSAATWLDSEMVTEQRPAAPAPDPARPCVRVGAGELAPGDPTPGMTREVALRTDGMWSGTVDTDAGAVSGWHHHGDHDTTLYIVSGAMRLESGRGGRHIVTAGPGDFLHVPAGAVHRESNPGGERSRAVIVRCGSGTPTVNVAGPAGP